MDEIKKLESLGLVLPSPLYIIGAFLFGIIGYVVFRRGRKTTSSMLTWTGGYFDGLSICRVSDLAFVAHWCLPVRIRLFQMGVSVLSRTNAPKLDVP